jgi:hypothetical protein
MGAFEWKVSQSFPILESAWISADSRNKPQIVAVLVELLLLCLKQNEILAAMACSDLREQVHRVALVELSTRDEEEK